MMRLKFVLSVILILAVAVALWLRPLPSLKTLPTPVVQVAQGPVVKPDAAVAKFQSGTSKERLPEFLAGETQRVGTIDANPKATEERLNIVAQSLDAEEAAWLGNRALDGKEEGDARFLSVYLLAKGNPDSSLKTLKKIASAKLPEKSSSSATELERQIRAMAIEGISGARGVIAARDELQEIAVQQSDPFLKDRAQRGLFAWKTGKKVEDQDKEGLRKLREQQ